MSDLRIRWLLNILKKGKNSQKLILLFAYNSSWYFFSLSSLHGTGSLLCSPFSEIHPERHLLLSEIVPENVFNMSFAPLIIFFVLFGSFYRPSNSLSYYTLYCYKASVYCCSTLYIPFNYTSLQWLKWWVPTDLSMN